SSPPASLLRRRDRGAPLWLCPRAIGPRGTDFEVAEVQLARELETAPKTPRAVMAAQPPRAPGGRGPQARSDRRGRPGPGGPGLRRVERVSAVEPQTAAVELPAAARPAQKAAPRLLHRRGRRRRRGSRSGWAGPPRP